MYWKTPLIKRISKYYSPSVTDSRQVLQESIDLVGCGYDTTIKSKSVQLAVRPFSFLVPMNVPPSFIGKHGSIKYWLTLRCKYR